jgi:hypothetical protein
MRPSSDIVRNMITGVKVSGLLSLAMAGIQLIAGGKTLDDLVTVGDPLSLAAIVKTNAPLLGAGFLVQDGEMYNLDGRSRKGIGYGDMGMESIDAGIQNMLNGGMGSPIRSFGASKIASDSRMQSRI